MDKIVFIKSLYELESLINQGFKFSDELMDCYNNTNNNIELIKLVINENQINLSKMIDNYILATKDLTLKFTSNTLVQKIKIKSSIDEYNKKYKNINIFNKFISSIFKSLNKEMNVEYAEIQKLKSDLLILEEKYKIIEDEYIKTSANFFVHLNNLKKELSPDLTKYEKKLELMNNFKSETMTNKFEINSLFLEINSNLNKKFTNIKSLFQQFNYDIENFNPNAIIKVNVWMNEKVNSATNDDLNIRLDPKLLSFNIGKSSIKLTKSALISLVCLLAVNTVYNEIISPKNQVLINNIAKLISNPLDYNSDKVINYIDEFYKTKNKSNELERK